MLNLRFFLSEYSEHLFFELTFKYMYALSLNNLFLIIGEKNIKETQIIPSD